MVSSSFSSASPGLLCQMARCFPCQTTSWSTSPWSKSSSLTFSPQSYGSWCPTPECAPWRTTSSSTSRWRTSSMPPSTLSPTSPTCSPVTGLSVRTSLFQIRFALYQYTNSQVIFCHIINFLMFISKKYCPGHIMLLRNILAFITLLGKNRRHSLATD